MTEGGKDACKRCTTDVCGRVVDNRHQRPEHDNTGRCLREKEATCPGRVEFLLGLCLVGDGVKALEGFLFLKLSRSQDESVRFSSFAETKTVQISPEAKGSFFPLLAL